MLSGIGGLKSNESPNRQFLQFSNAGMVCSMTVPGPIREGDTVEWGEGIGTMRGNVIKAPPDGQYVVLATNDRRGDPASTYTVPLAKLRLVARGTDPLGTRRVSSHSNEVD
jgi:hypothetical protein